ncbi:SSI family serine proteinase inhibitor [Streptomyces sp. NPDC002784]
MNVKIKLAAAVLLSVFTALLTSTAAADPSPPSISQITRLELTITHPDPANSSPRSDPAASKARKAVVLECDPAGGTHPRSQQACTDLEASEGKIESLSGDQACTLLYAPVIATAEGTWRGRPVKFEQQYGNDCEMQARTRNIFKF